MWKRLARDLPRRSIAFDLFAVGAVLALGLSAPTEAFRRSGHEILVGPRSAVIGRIERVFDPPVSHWISGLLLGEDRGFSKKWKEIFRVTGTLHLTAVSGQNVGMVLSALGRPLRYLPIRRRGRYGIQMLFVVGFVLLTGAPSSVVRAAFMWACVEFAGTVLGRPVKRLRALLVAVLILVAIDRSVFLNDRGFQLSVLATFGLAALAPVFADLWFRDPAWKRKGWRRDLRDAVCQSVAASLMTAPLIAWMTGRYSVVALMANVAVSFFIPFLMAAGAVVTALSYVWLGGAATIAALFAWLFALPLTILGVMAALPFAATQGVPAWAALALSTSACLFALIRRRRAQNHETLSYETPT